MTLLDVDGSSAQIQFENDGGVDTIESSSVPPTEVNRSGNLILMDAPGSGRGVVNDCHTQVVVFDGIAFVDYLDGRFECWGWEHGSLAGNYVMPGSSLLRNLRDPDLTSHDSSLLPEPSPVAATDEPAEGAMSAAAEQSAEEAMPAVAEESGGESATGSDGLVIPAVSRSADFAYVVTYALPRSEPATYDRPGGAQIVPEYVWPDGTAYNYALANPTYHGNPLTLQVVRGAPGDEWIEVQLPVRPAGTTAWVKAVDWNWSSTDIRVTISLSNRKLEVFQGGALIREPLVHVGSETRPTPLLSMGYVDELVSNETDVISLGLYADEMPGEYFSGLPRVGIRGWNRPMSEDQTTSGSVRVTEAVFAELQQHLAPGTIVQAVP